MPRAQVGKTRQASNQAGKPPAGHNLHRRRGTRRKRGRQRDRSKPVHRPHPRPRILPSAIRFPWPSPRQQPRPTRDRMTGSPRSRCRMARYLPTQQARVPPPETRSGRVVNPRRHRTILSPRRNRKRRQKQRAIRAIQRVRPVRGRRKPVLPHPEAGTVPAMKICRRRRWEKEILGPTRRWIPIPETRLRTVG